MKVKKQENIDAFKAKIITEAKALLEEEGIAGFSVRKLTDRFEYSPGILYHYFKNKDEILAAVTMDGYQNILQIIRNASSSEDASIRLCDTLRAYILGMMEQKEIYLILLHSTYEPISSQVNLLEENIRMKRASMQALCQGIEAGIKQGIFTCTNVEARAQVIWCSMFGLIERMIQEHVDVTMRDHLITEFLSMICDSLERRAV